MTSVGTPQPVGYREGALLRGRMRAKDRWLAGLTGFPFALLREPPRGCPVGPERKTSPSTWKSPRRERAGGYSKVPGRGPVLWLHWWFSTSGHVCPRVCVSLGCCSLPTVTPGGRDRAKSLEPRPPCTFFRNPHPPHPPNEKHITKPGGIQAENIALLSRSRCCKRMCSCVCECVVSVDAQNVPISYRGASD